VEFSADIDESPITFATPDVSAADIEAVVRVMRSGWLTTGEECRQLEDELAAYLSIPQVVSMSSCTAALETAVAYLDLPPGARIVVPTWTFVSSALAPIRQGATAILLDIDEDTLNVSEKSIEAALHEGIDGAVIVHLGGVPVASGVRASCAAENVPVIEDAAHALGASDERGRLAGEGTVAACFSFYATKNLTCAEGGALATDDEGLADFARSFRLHGLSRDAYARYRPGSTAAYDLVSPGIKANLPDLLAALARSQLKRYGDLQARRRALVHRYRSNLTTIDGLRCVPEQLDENGADHLMIVVLPEGVDRGSVVHYLNGAGVASSVHFQPLHTFPWFEKNVLIGPGGTPVADALAARVLSLPLHPGLTTRDVDRVCDTLCEAVAL
jgi:dTDP-4-amino-4,6-dideoxygalactose transaminase